MSKCQLGKRESLYALFSTTCRLGDSVPENDQTRNFLMHLIQIIYESKYFILEGELDCAVIRQIKQKSSVER